MTNMSMIAIMDMIAPQLGQATRFTGYTTLYHGHGQETIHIGTTQSNHRNRINRSPGDFNGFRGRGSHDFSFQAFRANS
jgi:hypothetical protein